ncbi:MAG: GNAT family N-acetyltransferase [Bacteroidetes bacterium]|nr:GNAT family N-acetyltransferase [Bacteroidota bacterium]
MKQTERKPRGTGAEIRRAGQRVTPPFIIRRAKRADLPTIVKLSKGVKEIENYPGQKMKADDFLHFVEGGGGLMLVAAVKGKVVGYVAVYESENYFYLPYAVTDKKWRKHGVGSALLAEVERMAKEEKVEYILMSVYVYNSNVHSFLKARGYVASKKLVQYSKTIANRGNR